MPCVHCIRTAAWVALYRRLADRNWVTYAKEHGIPIPIVAYAEAP